MDEQPTTTDYWVFYDRSSGLWKVYEKVVPHRSISWGSAPLKIVNEEVADYSRAYGKLPPAESEATP